MSLKLRKRWRFSLVNKNYNRGRRFEYRVKKFFEDLGFYVVRSAGSKGLADLVIIKNGESRLVQCKYGCGFISKKEYEDLERLCNELLVSGYIALTDKKGHIRFRFINDLSNEEVEILERQVEE